jgi:hypothetical protein
MINGAGEVAPREVSDSADGINSGRTQVCPPPRECVGDARLAS